MMIELVKFETILKMYIHKSYKIFTANVYLVDLVESQYTARTVIFNILLGLKIPDNRSFKYFYDLCEIYTCIKYFVVSIYESTFISNFVDIITTIGPRYSVNEISRYLIQQIEYIYERFL